MDQCIARVPLMVILLSFILQAANTASAGKSLERNGEALIGGLVSVHQKGTVSDSECATPDLNGILTVEAILFAIEEINSKKHVDLNATLGCDIRDTCPRPYKAALDLVLNRPKEPFLAAAVGKLPHDEQSEYRQVILLLLSSSTPHMSCIPSTYRVKKKPDLISHAEFIFHATARDRTNLRAIADLAARYNWTYTALVYDDSDEGRYRASLFQQEAAKKFVCVARNYLLPVNSSETQIRKFVSSLEEEKNYSVIVMLTSKNLFKGIIDEAFKQKVVDLTWIVSDGSWDNKVRFLKNNTAAQGMFRVGTSASIVDFKTFLSDLHNNPQRNEWIMEMVTSTSSVPSLQPPAPTNLSSDSNLTTNSPNPASSATPIPITTFPPSTRQCSDPPCGVNKTKLKQVVEALMSMADSATCTIDSIFAVAHALAHREKCKKNCPENHEFHTYIQNVNFKSLSGHRIRFNHKRNLYETEYKIWNLQKNVDSSAMSADDLSKLQLSTVGSWKQSGNGTPEMTLRSVKEIQWNAKSDEIPKSICHQPCNPGTYKALRKNPAESECCWHCIKCAKNTVSKIEDSLACTACPDGQAASTAQDHCIEQYEDYAYWSDAGSLVMLFIMVVGVCFNVYVAVVFFKNRDTPVMRRSKNALLITLPLVIILFLVPIPLFSKPSDLSCEGYRAFFTLALCIPLTALIAKSLYVDNRFYDEEGQIKESWGNSMCTPRIVVAMVTIVVHVIVIIIIALFFPNHILRFPTDDPFTVYIECSIHTGFGFLFIILYIMFIATLYSILSANEEISPGNDMEVRWTSLCMFFWYAICFIYVAVGHGVYGKGKVWGLAFVDFLFAVDILACIYLPKWYVIVFQPEKNQADVSPWSIYVKTQEQASLRVTNEDSPMMEKRGSSKEPAKNKDHGDPDKTESQELMNDTDV